MSKYAVMPLIDYADTCGAIRARITDQSIIKSSEMPMKITEVYANGRDEGYNQGWDIGYRSGFDEGMSRADVRYEEGLSEGKEQGKAEVYAQIEPINAQLENTLNGTDTGGKSFYDEFWDNYQQNGNRTDYSSCFAGEGWTKETFKPKYNITPIGEQSAYMLFRESAISGDLAEILKNNGITLAFSLCTGWLSYVFNNTSFTRIGVVDLSKATGIQALFSTSTQLHTIDKLVCTESLQYLETPFILCSALENLTIDGVIGQNGFDVQWSTKLSNASIISIINALSTTASGKSVTLSKVAVESAFGSTASEEWISLINTRSNWTINLV